MRGWSKEIARAAAAALGRAGFAEVEDLARLALVSYRLRPQRGDEPHPGASRFGGRPDLPAGFTWPVRDGVPLAFLAQLDLAALHVGDLPQTGWLLVFYDVARQPWGFDADDRDAARVVHVQAPRAALRRAAAPPPGTTEYPRCTLDLTSSIDLPDPFDAILPDHEVDLADDELDAYGDALAELAGHDAAHADHHLLGHPQLIQGDMRHQCALVTSGLALTDEATLEGPAAQLLTRGASRQWRLLLQLDSDQDGPGWTWADEGRLYLWIRRDDLAAARFDEVWVILQSH